MIRHGARASLRTGSDRRAAARSLAEHGTGRFDAVERYCMFVGTPRSGHSLVGSILDAHPEIVLAHEEDALRYVAVGAARDELFDRLCANSQKMAAGGRAWSGYSYDMPGQHQGVTSTVRVLGDKKGAQSTRRLGCRPGLLRLLRSTVRVPLRVVHVIRRPLDNIATMAYRACGSKDARVTPRALTAAARRYFTLHETVQAIASELAADEHLVVHGDDLAADARVEIARVLKFLGVAADPEFLDATRALVRPEPNRSAGRFQWSPTLAREIEVSVCNDPLLARYSASFDA
jgi:hypothetical protein